MALPGTPSCDEPESERTFARLADALLGSADVSRSIRGGRVLLSVGGRIFAVKVGRCLVVRLPTGRAAALVRSGLALSLDPAEDSLLKGWVTVSPGENGTWLRFAREACEYVRGQNVPPPMSSARHGCLSSRIDQFEIGGTMAAPFVWFDLRTKDEALTLAFYQELLNWDIEGGAGQPAMMKGAEGPWAAVAPSADGDSQWVPYVQVEDVDAATEKAGQLGAKIVSEKTAGPAGEYAVIADPAGAMLALWQPSQA